MGGHSRSPASSLTCCYCCWPTKVALYTKGAIAEHLSGDAAEQFNSFEHVYAHVKNLKRKPTEAGAANYIRMMYGLGYRFAASEQ
ncbi:MAG: helix-turn-helix domain-containing protein [Cytophagaceae bacterium]|nr:MAG: helix-turn-helix domain-containing protein [Cytophagaceae bacterium]